MMDSAQLEKVATRLTAQFHLRAEAVHSGGGVWVVEVWRTNGEYPDEIWGTADLVWGCDLMDPKDGEYTEDSRTTDLPADTHPSKVARMIANWQKETAS